MHYDFLNKCVSLKETMLQVAKSQCVNLSYCNTGYHITKEGQKLQVNHQKLLSHLPTANALDAWLHLNRSHNSSSMQMRCWIYWKNWHHLLLCLPKFWKQWRVAVNLDSAQVSTSACLLEMVEQIQMKYKRYWIQLLKLF